MDTSAPAQAVPPTDDPFLKGVFESPIIKQLQSGDVPPVYLSPSIFGQHAEAVVPKLQQALPSIGLGILNAPKSGVLVAFNPKIYTPDEILQADSQGQLDQIAVPLQAQGQGGAPAGAPAAPAAPAPAPASPAPIAAGLMGGSDPLQKARAQTMAPKPPVKQPLPSQGIINGLIGRAT